MVLEMKLLKLRIWLSRYTDDGELMCYICKTKIASENDWNDHCASKRHLKVGFWNTAIKIIGVAVTKGKIIKE